MKDLLKFSFGLIFAIPIALTGLCLFLMLFSEVLRLTTDFDLIRQVIKPACHHFLRY